MSLQYWKNNIHSHFSSFKAETLLLLSIHTLHHRTIHQLIHVLHQICIGLDAGIVVWEGFLDLLLAFDITLRTGLLFKLQVLYIRNISDVLTA